MHLDAITNYVSGQLVTNNVFSGVALACVLASAWATLRSYPGRIYRWIKHCFILEFEIIRPDEAYFWFDEWLSQQPYATRRAKWLSVRTIDRGRRENEPPEIILSPAPGLHWFWWRRRMVVVTRIRKETPGQTDGTTVERESFAVRMFTRNRGLITELLHEARKLAHPEEEIKVQIMGWNGGYAGWSDRCRCTPRPLDSIILEDGVSERIIGDVQWFLDNRQWYAERGIPYRRGYLWHGPPGSGKSTLAMGVASHLRLNLGVINLSAVTDGTLAEAIGKLPTGCLLLLEDVDAAFVGRQAQSKLMLTFSGLLNAIDGVGSPDGLIVMMTTNHPELLDPALVRPGRVDLAIKIDNATASQSRRMYLRFFPNELARADEFAARIAAGPPVSMAALQGHFIRHAASAQDTLASIDEVYEPVAEPKPLIDDAVQAEAA